MSSSKEFIGLSQLEAAEIAIEKIGLSQSSKDCGTGNCNNLTRSYSYMQNTEATSSICAAFDLNRKMGPAVL